MSRVLATPHSFDDSENRRERSISYLIHQTSYFQSRLWARLSSRIATTRIYSWRLSNWASSYMDSTTQDGKNGEKSQVQSICINALFVQMYWATLHLFVLSCIFLQDTTSKGIPQDLLQQSMTVYCRNYRSYKPVPSIISKAANYQVRILRLPVLHIASYILMLTSISSTYFLVARKKGGNRSCYSNLWSNFAIPTSQLYVWESGVCERICDSPMPPAVLDSSYPLDGFWSAFVGYSESTYGIFTRKQMDQEKPGGLVSNCTYSSKWKVRRLW